MRDPATEQKFIANQNAKIAADERAKFADAEKERIAAPKVEAQQRAEDARLADKYSDPAERDRRLGLLDKSRSPGRTSTSKEKWQTQDARRKALPRAA